MYNVKDVKNISQNLDHFKKESKISYNNLLELMNIKDIGTIKKWLKGNNIPSLKNLIKLKIISHSTIDYWLISPENNIDNNSSSMMPKNKNINSILDEIKEDPDKYNNELEKQVEEALISLSENLKDWRTKNNTKKKLNQSDLACKLKVPRESISKWENYNYCNKDEIENKHIPLEKLIKLSSISGHSCEDFLTRNFFK